MKILFAILFACLASGCQIRHAVIASTGTVIGFELAENPTTGMYQAKFGFSRAEFAYVPSNRSAHPGDASVGAGAKDTTDVLMELRYGSIMSKDAQLYQRLAVGSIAVTQPGAALMFAKSKDGTLDPATAAAVTGAIKGVPVMSNLKEKYELSLLYRVTTRKGDYDEVAKRFGYTSFSEFLVEALTKPEVLQAITEAIRALSK